MSTKESTKESDEKTSGEKRTRSGCLTCKKRRVKCDEGKPRCKNCGKKGRECVYHDDSLSLKVVEYPHDVDETPLEMPATDYTFISIDPSRSRKASETKSRVKEEAQGGPSRSAVSPRSTPPSPIHPYTSLKKFGIEEFTGVLSSSNTLPPESAQTLSAIVVSPTDHEGALIHYFTEKLGRWLDCGHLVRHFTLGIPEKLESCSTLHEAVLLFAARHKGDRSINTYADEMHQLYAMERSMSEKNADTDDLLCTLLISHFVEQLNASGTQTLKFLHQASSVVDRCMGQSVDSSAPTFRDAAFWLYVRQWILSVLRYTQQPHAETPPDMHFSRQLYINPAVSNNLVKWSNEVTWHTAQIVAFCSKDHSQIAEDRTRACEWQERWDGIRKVWNERPRSMEPLFEDQQYDDTSSPRIWFKAEWHATGFGFYHLASILLLRDQQAFTNGKNKALLGGTESMILGHGRKLCGASECNPEYATLGMIFCNSVLLWFNLISGGEEQDKLVGLLRNIEGNHSWPTAWIMDGLNRSVDISMEDQI